LKPSELEDINKLKPDEILIEERIHSFLSLRVANFRRGNDPVKRAATAARKKAKDAERYAAARRR
jgi:hypothetical protein